MVAQNTEGLEETRAECEPGSDSEGSSSQTFAGIRMAPGTGSIGVGL